MLLKMPKFHETHRAWAAVFGIEFAPDALCALCMRGEMWVLCGLSGHSVAQ